MSEIKTNKISPRTNCGTVTVGDSGDSVAVSAGVPVTVNNNLTVSGDLKSAALKAADGGVIISQSGTAITIGASGDTVSLASGASQSGFGRAGSVNWQTTIKTSTFTAASGEGYFCNTNGGAFTLNLPSSPSAGDIVAFADYDSSFGSNNLTIGRGGSNIQGSASDFVATNSGISMTVVYADATKGWIVVADGDIANKDASPEFVSGSGGSESTSGSYKIHSFTGPGTFTITNAGNTGGSNKIDYMVVAGGGGGGGEDGGGGGGGGGGYRESQRPDAAPLYAASPLHTNTSLEGLAAAAYPITVGGGGSGAPGSGGCSGPRGSEGSNSVFSTITSAGGGGGGGGANHPGGNLRAGSNGGSGGGGSRNGGAGGSGNTPPVSPAQGKDGGASGGAGNCGGGGGGAETVGASAGTPSNGGGPGGNGTITFITGSPTSYSGGGGGNSESAGPKGTGGPGGGGGGSGNPGAPPLSAGSGGTNQGGGGGGIDTNGSSGNAGSGGSGRVIIRYKYQ
jgi:hypothetical protein